MICSVYNLGWGLFHLSFWKVLRWGDELPKLSPTNAAVMQILNLCLTWIFFLCAYLYWVFGADLAHSPLGRALAGGVCLLWVTRTVEQVIFMDMRRRVHQVLLVLFVLGAGLHAAVLWPGSF